MATNGAIVAILAAQAQAERHAFEAFRTADATAPERARTLNNLELPESMALRALTNRGIVREAEPGLFWLDERKAAERSRASKPMLVAVILLLVLLGIALAVMMNVRQG
ncbi:MAG TPA: hypothetical protein VK420_20465 [Longimicrobium sp.]|jgi:hypothetical protein|nr:hypothetical protein [Longimicrobium sp.]